MSNKTNLVQRTSDAFSQFTRYDDGVENDNIADVLETLTDINDDIVHARDPGCVGKLVERAKAELDKLLADYVQQIKTQNAYLDSLRKEASTN